MNTDRTFYMSPKAFYGIKASGEAAGMTVFSYFRHKAWALAGSINPQFIVDGTELSRRVDIGIALDTFIGLQQLALDLGVPEDAIGELVASFVLPELVEA